jgi:hypothetical protein
MARVHHTKAVLPTGLSPELLSSAPRKQGYKKFILNFDFVLKVFAGQDDWTHLSIQNILYINIQLLPRSSLSYWGFGLVA